MFGSLLSRAELAGVGIVLKVGADGGLYVKSMQKKGPAWGSNIVQVGDLLLEVDGRDAFKPADKVKKMILGQEGTSCEFLLKRWACDGEESVIYSTSLLRTKLSSDELDGTDGSCQARATSPPLRPAAKRASLATSLGSPVTIRQTGSTAMSPLSLSPLKKANKTWGKAEDCGGIGIVFKVSKQGTMVVKSMISTGSASRSNLVQVGDILIKINGKKMLGKPVENVVRHVLGTVGSVADVQFQRQANTLSGEPGAVYRVMLTRGITAEMEEAVPVISPPASNSATARPDTITPEIKLNSSLVDSPDDTTNRLPKRSSPLTEDLPRESSTVGLDSRRKTISVFDQHEEHKEQTCPQRSGPHTAEKSTSVQGPISALDSAPTAGHSTTNSSPTEHVLKGRQEQPHESGEKGGTGSARMRLTLARCLSDLTLSGQDDNTEDFKRELLSELGQALKVTTDRFQILHVWQTNTKVCMLDIELLAADDVVSSNGLMPMQLALEVQRQVADPLAPLRNAAWFSYVMNVIITSKPASEKGKDMQVGGVPMPNTHFGAPLHFGVPSAFGGADASSRQLLLDGINAQAPMMPFAFGAPESKGPDLLSLFVDEKSDADDGAWSSTLVPTEQGFGNIGYRSETIATAINELRREQPSPGLVASWLADQDVSANRSSEDSTDSLHGGELRRSSSMPELHYLFQPGDSRSAHEAHSRRLQLRIASKEQQQQALKTENDALRAQVTTLQASEQRLIAEARILKGLSVSQGKEIVAYQLQTRTLATQLREQKKKKKRGDDKAGNLSQVFSLEQQLHAEKARVVELTKALERAGAIDADSEQSEAEPRLVEESGAEHDSATPDVASLEASPRLLDLCIASASAGAQSGCSEKEVEGKHALTMLSPRKMESLETTALTRVDLDLVRKV